MRAAAVRRRALAADGGKSPRALSQQPASLAALAATTAYSSLRSGAVFS